MKPHPEHSKISPTAKLVAYWRQFSDVPFAQEVSKLVDAGSVFKSFLKDTSSSIEDISWFAPLIEARYKSMVNAIRRQKFEQVLELASGVSLRGLAMTQEPGLVYVETDLPGMSSEKVAVAQKIRELKNIPNRNNLFFKEANVLDFDALQKAVTPFSEKKPIAVIHEGLFQYLSLEEKEIAAKHIHSLLERFGGAWMTPDLDTKEDIDTRWKYADNMKRLTQNIETTTQRDFRDFAFENQTHRQQFFEKVGFEIQEFPQLDGTYELTSPKTLPIKQETLNNFTQNLKIWSLRIKS